MELLGENTGWFLVFYGPTALLSKIIKFLQNVLEIFPKKTSCSTIEGKIYLIIIKGYIQHPTVKHSGKG